MEPLARDLTGRLEIPTIGIGTSPACDGQILVTEDMAGLFAGFTPRFVKRYAALGEELTRAAEACASEGEGAHLARAGALAPAQDLERVPISSPRPQRKSNCTLAHRDAGGRSCPPHQDRT